jgi:hypothetical protein
MSNIHALRDVWVCGTDGLMICSQPIWNLRILWQLKVATVRKGVNRGVDFDFDSGIQNRSELTVRLTSVVDKLVGLL